MTPRMNLHMTHDEPTILTQPNMSEINAIISGCCNAFIEYIDGNCICTKCGRNIDSIKNGEELTTSIVYNVVQTDTLNMSSDLLQDRLVKFKRNANDITCALTAVKCDKCGGFCRMSRNQTGQKIFVCIKCRHTFTFN